MDKNKINKTTFYKKYNNLISTDYDYDTLYNYLEFGQYPIQNPTPEQIAYYDLKYKHFKIGRTRNKIITYEIPEKKIKLQVIQPSTVQDVIDEEYKKKDDLALGKGIKLFYKLLQSKYIGITRDNVDEYLKNSPEYSLNSSFSNRLNKPIIAKKPNALWCIDLIDMGLELTPINNGYRYILSIIDTFTRFVYLEKLKFKNAPTVASALERVINRNEVQPDAILSDNGTEFKAEFTDLLNELNIAHREIRTYTPQANGIAERSNREIRKIIKAIFIRHNTNQWYDRIREIEKIKNSTYHSTIKTTPSNVNNYNEDDADDYIEEIYNNVVEDAKTRLNKYKESEYKTGDKVIVSMAIVFSDVRRKMKAGLKKELIVLFMPHVFIIKSVIQAKNSLERKRYTLKSVNENTYLRSPNSNEYTRVYASDLKTVNVDDFDMTIDEALNLNGCERRATDLRIV